MAFIYNRNKEKAWMSEKDRLLQELDAMRDHVSVRKEDKSKHRAGVSSYLADYEARQQLEAEIKTMNVQLEQAGKQIIICYLIIYYRLYSLYF